MLYQHRQCSYARDKDKQVNIRCLVCNEIFEQRAGNHTHRGSGCPCCANRQLSDSNNLLVVEPKLASQWHPTKNGSLTPKDVVAGGHTTFWWKCPVADDHEWEATINHRLSKETGCPCCSGHKIVLSNCVTTINPHLIPEWHPTKNGTLTPADITAGSCRKVWWLGKCGHEWIATVGNRKHTGCPICKESRGEKKIVSILERLGLLYKRQAKFASCKFKKYLPFDFLVKTSVKKGFLIEYNGVQHYKPVRWDNDMSDERMIEIFEGVKTRDKIKQQWAKNRNVPLLVIPYWEKDNIEKMILEFLPQEVMV